MKKVCLFLAPGFEESEAIITVDLLRRAGIAVTTAAIGPSTTVSGSHGIAVRADADAKDVLIADYDMLALPGGIPGTPNLKASPQLCSALAAQLKAGRRVAAICAAPTILAGLGLLDGVHATCYPSCAPDMGSAVYEAGPVVTDGLITTGNGVGGAIPFALELIRLLESPEKAQQIGTDILWMS